MSGNLRRHVRAGLSGASVVLVGVAVYWAALPGPLPPALVQVPGRNDAPADLQAQIRPAPPPDAVEALPETPAAMDTEQATVAEYAGRKYRFLLDDLHLPPAELAQLRRALLLREQLAGLPDDARRQAALAESDQRIRALLHPADYAVYDALKDSDLEQFQLEQYAGGINEVAPLSAGDQRSILRTKLEYKARFRQLVQDSGLLRADLAPAERDYAFDATRRALQEYKQDYLREVRQYLVNDEQYRLLDNYENTEFTAELARLRAMARGS